MSANRRKIAIHSNTNVTHPLQQYKLSPYIKFGRCTPIVIVYFLKMNPLVRQKRIFGKKIFSHCLPFLFLNFLRQ